MLFSGENKSFIAIDLKSFYASAECVARGLDPLTTNLVVADSSRTEKTICLAVSPSLKAYGIPGRPRLFEVVEKVRQLNAGRKDKITYITAVPRMQLYMDVSSEVYNIYLRYIAPEDIHVYSVDEVFIDATSYLGRYETTAQDLCIKLIREVLDETGITATAGVGTNMYLAKIAMDIVAKHMPADENGVRLASLDEMSYRRFLWTHRPLTDFWRLGTGYAGKLEKYGMLTMGDIARCSIKDEDLLYRLFGVNAANLIDHAWGYDDTTMAAIKSYRSANNSLSRGQVLKCPYSFEKGRLIVKEMADLLVLDLVEKNLITDRIALSIGYDVTSLRDNATGKQYKGEVAEDRYGRMVPKPANGSIALGRANASTKLITEAVMKLYDRITDPTLLLRRMSVTADHVVSEETAAPDEQEYEQLDLFTDYKARDAQKEAEKEALAREKRVQKAALEIQKKFGKNALLKGMNLEDGATTMERNEQIGGHKA